MFIISSLGDNQVRNDQSIIDGVGDLPQEDAPVCMCKDDEARMTVFINLYS